MTALVKRLERAEGATKHLPGPDDPLGQFSARDWAGAFSEILDKPVPVVGRARGLRAARAAMEALSVPDLKAVLTWLRAVKERQGNKV